MEFVTSLSVEHTPGEANPFWPHAPDRLVVVVARPDRHSHMLVAYGIDPEHRRVVFEHAFPRAQLSAFIKAAIDGDRAVFDLCNNGPRVAPASDHATRGDDRGSRTDEVAIAIPPDPYAKDLVARAAVALALALRANERLAESVATRSRVPERHKEPC